MIENLLAALRAEFGESDVTFYAEPPSQPIAPSVVVYPGNPFLEPREAASPLVREHWNIRVVASAKDVGTSVSQMRRNSLKIRRAVNRSGGVWHSASGPIGVTTAEGVAPEFVFSENEITFRYDATEITDPSS